MNDIIERYKKMDPKVNRIQILSELFDCGQDYIRKLIGAQTQRDKHRDAFLELYNQGFSDKDIAEKTGKKYDTVQIYRKRLGLGPNKPAR